ncbi:hypothetical protein ACFL4S_02045, partial [bacterium]
PKKEIIDQRDFDSLCGGHGNELGNQKALINFWLRRDLGAQIPKIGILGQFTGNSLVPQFGAATDIGGNRNNFVTGRRKGSSLAHDWGKLHRKDGKILYDIVSEDQPMGLEVIKRGFNISYGEYNDFTGIEFLLDSWLVPTSKYSPGTSRMAFSTDHYGKFMLDPDMPWMFKLQTLALNSFYFTKPLKLFSTILSLIVLVIPGLNVFAYLPVLFLSLGLIFPEIINLLGYETYKEQYGTWRGLWLWIKKFIPGIFFYVPLIPNYATSQISSAKVHGDFPGHSPVPDTSSTLWHQVWQGGKGINKLGQTIAGFAIPLILATPNPVSMIAFIWVILSVFAFQLGPFMFNPTHRASQKFLDAVRGFLYTMLKMPYFGLRLFEELFITPVLEGLSGNTEFYNKYLMQGSVIFNLLVKYEHIPFPLKVKDENNKRTWTLFGINLGGSNSKRDLAKDFVEWLLDEDSWFKHLILGIGLALAGGTIFTALVLFAVGLSPIALPIYLTIFLVPMLYLGTLILLGIFLAGASVISRGLIFISRIFNKSSGSEKSEENEGMKVEDNLSRDGTDIKVNTAYKIDMFEPMQIRGKYKGYTEEWSKNVKGKYFNRYIRRIVDQNGELMRKEIYKEVYKPKGRKKFLEYVIMKDKEGKVRLVNVETYDNKQRPEKVNWYDNFIKDGETMSEVTNTFTISYR